MRILAIGNVFNPSGGSKHVINVLKELGKMGDEVTLYVPATFVRPGDEVLKDLERYVNVHPTVYDVTERRREGRISYFLRSHTVYLNWNDLEEDAESVRKLEDVRADVVYDMHEDSITLRLSYHVARRIGKPLVKLLHMEPFRNSFGRGYRRIMGVPGLAYDTLMWVFYKLDRRAFELAMRDHTLRGIAAVSQSCITLSGIDRMTERYGVRLHVYKVGNAFDVPSNLRRVRGKENYAVFFARLVPQKGTRELPKVADHFDGRILVFGKLFSERERRALSHPKIDYLGYRPLQELYDAVSRAKVFIYPSHQDGFPLVVLESLALGTSVVAYDIPAIRYGYSGIKPVKTVREHDVLGMARAANEVMNMKEEEYESEHNDERVKEFLRVHSSWGNVAQETHDFLSTFAKA